MTSHHHRPLPFTSAGARFEQLSQQHKRPLGIFLGATQAELQAVEAGEEGALDMMSSAKRTRHKLASGSVGAASGFRWVSGRGGTQNSFQKGAVWSLP